MITIERIRLGNRIRYAVVEDNSTVSLHHTRKSARRDVEMLRRADAEQAELDAQQARCERRYPSSC